MRIAYLDCFSGLSGDMFLGAAVDAGVPLEKLQTVARNLGLQTDLVSRRLERCGIAATKVDVLIQGHPDQPSGLDQHAHDDEHSPGHHHPHDHEHEHEHSHDHAHDHAPAHQPGTHIHRGLKEIREIIAHAAITPAARAFAIRAFE